MEQETDEFTLQILELNHPLGVSAAKSNVRHQSTNKKQLLLTPFLGKLLEEMLDQKKELNTGRRIRKGEQTLGLWGWSLETPPRQLRGSQRGFFKNLRH